MKVTMCDPPSGWKYGFPKAMPQESKDEDFDVVAWLITSGYPKNLIDSLGKSFYVRYWDEKITLSDHIDCGDGATMSIPYFNPHSDNENINWITRYGDIEAARFDIAMILDSYSYLISDEITMKEATRRLRLLRKRFKENKNAK